jgi:phenylalanyl-tRNA synthetase beta chain
LPGADGIYVLEFDLDALTARAPQGTRFARPLPRHPSVVRDVSIVVDNSLSADSVRGTIRAASPATLIDVREFDRYQGKGIPEGKVSLSLRLTFQAPDRTLTDTEVNAAMDAIVGALTRTLGAIQR